MRARIRNEGQFTIVELEGYLNFESALPIQDYINDIYKLNKEARILVDLKSLQFVGSSGVSNFVKGLRVFNRLKMKPFYFGVKPEFIRMFRAFEEDTPFEVHTSKADAFEAALARYNEWQANQERSKATH